jgi:hypothetical protein
MVHPNKEIKAGGQQEKHTETPPSCGEYAQTLAMVTWLPVLHSPIPTHENGKVRQYF